MKLKLTDEQIDRIEVVEAAVNDGYWEDRARKDIKKVYIQGLIDATKSMKTAYISSNTPTMNAVNRRLKSHNKMLEELS